MTYPDRYIIQALVKEGEYKGQRITLYFSQEGGGWWQWSKYDGWNYRFQSMDDPHLNDALRSAPKMGPWYFYPDASTIEVVAVPAIVKVY